MKATYKIVEGKTNRQLAHEALKAMSLICGYSNGTINYPFELASSKMEDGRTLISRSLITQNLDKEFKGITNVNFL